MAEHVFSEDVLDLTNMNTGELAIKKMSICMDFVEGGAEVMIFTGGDSNVNKISYAKSTFHADFFQINPHDESRIWHHRVTILDNQLHGVGQHLGGVHFCVPPFDRQGNGRPTLIERETENVFMELIKTNKNNSTIQAKSDPLSFVYKPSAMTRITLKRPRDPAHFANVLGKLPKMKEEITSFQSSFIPQTPQIFQVDHEQLNMNIPQTVHVHEPVPSIPQLQDMNVQGAAFLDVTNPFSPTSAMELMNLQSPQSHHPSSPANLLSPNPHGYSTSPYGTQDHSPVNSPMMQHRSPGPVYAQSQNNPMSPNITPNAQYSNGDVQSFNDIGVTIDLDVLTDLDLVGSINGNIGMGMGMMEKYLQDGRSACTVAMDGGGGVSKGDNIKKEIRRNKNDKKIRENGRKDDVLTSMSKLKL